MQTRWGSLVEAAINIVIGYITAIAAQIVIFPLFGLYASTRDHLLIGICFTAVSIVRLYVLRRIFNAMKLFNR